MRFFRFRIQDHRVLALPMVFFLACPSGQQKASESAAVKPPPLTPETALFANPQESEGFFTNHRSEHKTYGVPKAQRIAKEKPYGGTVVEQRSGRKRLYDHNVLLRGIFNGRVEHLKFGNLASRFEGAAFVDFGSAILYGEGAPTVRDLYEDKEVRDHLSNIVATDINDTARRSTRYIERFNKRGKPFPFPLREIPLALLESSQFQTLLADFLKEPRTAVILRSASSGPDLYYTEAQVTQHLTAMRQALVGRNVIYLFNRFVLFKAAEEHQIHVLGTSAADTGLNHRSSVWERINWKRRRLEQAFVVDPKHVKLLAKPSSKLKALLPK